MARGLIFSFFLFYCVSCFAQGIPLCKVTPFIDEPTIDQVTQFIEVNKSRITTVNDFLACLPKSMKMAGQGLGAYSTFLYSSKSLQRSCVDPIKPRVLLAGHLIFFALTGHHERPECNNVEVMGFDPMEHTFKLRRINFVSPLQTHTSSMAEISPENPPLCLTCHRRDPRPNWNSYFVWTGVYGSVDGGFITHSKEGSYFDNFYKSIKEDDPYSYFDFSFLKRNYYPSDAFLPNAAIANRFAGLNNQRVYRILKNSPDFQKYKYAIYAGLRKCPQIEDFLPEDIRVNFKSTVMDLALDTSGRQIFDISTNIKELISFWTKLPGTGIVPPGDLLTIRSDSDSRGFDQEGYRHVLPANEVSHPDPDLEYGALRYLLENRGIKIQDWSLTLSKVPYYYETGYPSNSVTRFLELQLWYNDFKNLPQPTVSVPTTAAECSILKDASLKALAKN